MSFSRTVSRFLRGKGFTVTLIGLCVILGMLYCFVQQPRLLRMLDYKIYDAMLHARADGATTGVPVIIDLDEASLDAYGQWPWPRFLLARLLDRLAQNGVAAVGMDMLLSEKDRSSPGKIQEDLKRFLDLDVRFEGLPAEFYDYDELLARSLRMSVVLGMYGHFGGAGAPDATPAAQGPGEGGAPETSGAPDAPGAPETSGAPDAPAGLGSLVRKKADAIAYDAYLHKTDSATFPLPVFWPVASTALINMNADLDGVVRRLPLVALYKDKLYANLGLRVLMAALGQKSLVSLTGPDGLESVRVGQYIIPVQPDGGFVLPFRGPAKTFPYYSVKDVLSGKIGEQELKGRIAFVGTSAPGLLDIRITPLERVYPGVEAHATVVDAILAQSYLRVPPWTPGLQVMAIIIAGLASTLAFGFARSRVYLPLAVLLPGGALYGSWHYFGQGLIVSPLYVCLTMGLLGAVLLALRFWQEERQKNVLRSAFSRYVAPEIVERITKLEGDIFAGEEVELSIMFTDIRGFTSISEKLNPQQIVTLLNRYFTPMTALVRGNKGTLDKFIGDALMAFWNAPVEVPEHPRLATLTALRMQETLTDLNAGLREDFGVDIRMGVGVHTGKAYVGNMGSEELLNYTLIGDNVNLASRLEGLCAQFGVGIVVSAETKERCGEGIAFLPLDTLRVKGKAQPVSVFTAMRPEIWQQHAGEFERYLDAYALYASGDFSAALKAFSPLALEFADKKIYALYQERCARLAASPPESWDGVWTLTSK